MNLYIDFGGTSFRYQLDNLPVTILPSDRIDLKKFLDATIQKHPDISSIGISFAGQVQDGKIISSPNAHTHNFDVKRYIEEKYKIQLAIDNDLNCAAIAEHNALQVKSLAVFYIGTGFGSAFIDNNQLVTGANNKSGELGHIPFKKSPFICGCGRDDCLELYVSGSGIKHWCSYFKIDKEFSRLDLLESLNNETSNIIIDNFYSGLAHAFHTALNLFDFDHLVLGGSVGKNENIKEFLENEFLHSAFKREKLSISLSTLREGSLQGTKFLNK
jgi:glucokinase